MKIVKFLGGLGNQMFQYAFYKALKHKFNAVKADTSGFNNYHLHNGLELEEIFPIKLDIVSASVAKLYNPDFNEWHHRKLRRILGLKGAYYQEQQEFYFDTEIFKDVKKKYYWGYWQNPLYFSDVEDELRKDFTFRKSLDTTNEERLIQMRTHESIAVHIRRGDYIGHELLGNICDLNYYQQAINYIKEHIQQPIFYFFSDDIEWCKSNFKNLEAVFIDGNIGVNNYIDMQLMSNCKHQIIANSSFSWWGAWLNTNPNKMVIGPKKWIHKNDEKDIGILPSNWIKI
ncbi:alpha-1,2-fucosyltransferase [Pedobacter glucosidilyticus]|uniref:alpha-1,2-fucosyltransferase n=1 Tax=Pedobacter glucosidilyticus TaxID=1122941 RepID=UPI00047CAC50|nr:alpha-1,2-fucosyltransferase [Pedobacter glucosidilyticus]